MNLNMHVYPFSKAENLSYNVCYYLLELFVEPFANQSLNVCFGNITIPQQQHLNSTLLFIHGVSNYVFLNQIISLQEMRHIWRTLQKAKCKRNYNILPLGSKIQVSVLLKSMYIEYISKLQILKMYILYILTSFTRSFLICLALYAC